ncbi:MAG: hypothetical protein DME62_11045 [Verrucomicrobia bacterium]|nr:MAG: hypothetical protein DME62_11045 [Verrucomicrobiota bacterium]
MSFLNVVEIESALIGLASSYPSVTQLITLPYFTVEGRQSHALRIGTGPCRRSAVLIISGAHAREWGGPDICINFAADLLEAYSLGTALIYGGTAYSAAEIKSIIERLDVIVFPDVNPDGRNYSQNTYPMWRKNRNPASSGGQASKIGVDPNRNYDFLSTALRPSPKQRRKTCAICSTSFPRSVGLWTSTRLAETSCIRGETTRTSRVH